MSAQSTRPGRSLEARDASYIAAMLPLLGWFSRHYFRVTSDGWQHVPASGPTLAVGSHNGGMATPDMHMLMYAWFRRFGVERPVYGLMHGHLWDIPPFSWLALSAEKMGAVRAVPEMAIAALRQQATVLVYPGGADDLFRPHALRHRIFFAGRQGFVKLAIREGVPILPTVSVGAHDTLFVLGNFREQLQQLGVLDLLSPTEHPLPAFPVYLGLPWGIAAGPVVNIPLPAPIHIRICPPIVFSRSGRAAASDRDYVDRCFEQVRLEMQAHLDGLVRDRRNGLLAP